MGGLQRNTITRLFAQRRASRRAQAASPGPDASNGPEILFVQSFQSGSIAQAGGTDGRYTVTLEHGLGQTIYFSDRPERTVGASPTAQFLAGLGFSPDNPPNAALVVENESGASDIAVVELFNPRYEQSAHTATYDAAVLANWEDAVDLGFTEAPVDLASIAARFGTAHLFIDGCPDGGITCQASGGSAGFIPSSEFGGFCYSGSDGDCLPCKPWLTSTSEAFTYWQGICNAQFSKCNGACEPLGVSRIEH